MVKSLQHHRDILLIPRSWWPHLHNTLEQDEPGWWYTVSKDMGYQGCKSCKNRIGKDHQDAERCRECPAKVERTQPRRKTKAKSKRDPPSKRATGPKDPNTDPIMLNLQTSSWTRTQKRSQTMTRATCGDMQIFVFQKRAKPPAYNLADCVIIPDELSLQIVVYYESMKQKLI
jgi:hypothetical protein